MVAVNGVQPIVVQCQAYDSMSNHSTIDTTSDMINNMESMDQDVIEHLPIV